MPLPERVSGSDSASKAITCHVSKRPIERRNSRDLKMRINVVLMSSS